MAFRKTPMTGECCTVTPVPSLASVADVYVVGATQGEVPTVWIAPKHPVTGRTLTCALFWPGYAFIVSHRTAMEILNTAHYAPWVVNGSTASAAHDVDL